MVESRVCKATVEKAGTLPNEFQMNIRGFLVGQGPSWFNGLRMWQTTLCKPLERDLRVFRASGKLRAEGLGLRASAYDVEVFTCPNMVQVQSGCQVHSARASAACTSQIFGRAMNTITERLFARSSS